MPYHDARKAAQRFADAYVAEYVRRRPGCTEQDVLRDRDFGIPRREALATVRRLVQVQAISRRGGRLWPDGTGPVPEGTQNETGDALRWQRAAGLRRSGLSLRAIAAELGVSHTTVLRDLSAARQAEAESVLLALGGKPPRKPRGPTVAEAAALAVEDARGKSSGLRWR